MATMFFAFFIALLFSRTASGEDSQGSSGSKASMTSIMSFGMGIIGNGEPITLKSIASYGLDITGISKKLNDIEQQLQEKHKNFLDNLNRATSDAAKSFSSNINLIMNVVDDHTLNGFFAELIPEVRVKGFGNNTCIEGIKTKKHHVGTLLLKNGILHYKKRMDLVTEAVEDRGDSSLFNSSFTFPDISVTLSWEFESSGVKWERKGTMEIVQKGPNLVTVTATVPRSRTLLDDMVSRHECFMKVEAMNVVLGDNVEVTAINYDSYVKSWFENDSVVKSLFTNVQGGTEYLVRNMIEDMEGHLMSQLKKTLKSIVAPVTMNNNVFCENPFTTPIPIDCQKIKNLGDYWRN